MKPCQSCHKEHSALLRCEVAARIAEATATHGRAVVLRELRKALPAMVPAQTVSTTRKGDRHSPGYQRDLMKVRRAIKAGRAERYPRTVN